MTTPPLAEVPIRTAEELTSRWATLLEPPEFNAHSLWLAGQRGRDAADGPAGRRHPSRPSGRHAGGLRRLHIAIAQDRLSLGGHLAMALCRPGRPDASKHDDAWAEGLRVALDGVPLAGSWSLHLAASGTVTPLVDLT